MNNENVEFVAEDGIERFKMLPEEKVEKAESITSLVYKAWTQICKIWGFGYLKITGESRNDFKGLDNFLSEKIFPAFTFVCPSVYRLSEVLLGISCKRWNANQTLSNHPHQQCDDVT